MPYRAPRAAALLGALDLSRALRPLMRRVPSRTQMTLDEAATVTRIAETERRVWTGVLRPAPERWFSVNLVIDRGASMVIWRQTIAELRQLLERQGAFRDIRVWSLDTDDPAEARIWASGSSGGVIRLAHPSELLDATGRQLVLVLSDCTGPAWHSGRVNSLLTHWAHRSPTAILQLLPERLWVGTALSHLLPVQLRAAGSGAPSAHLRIDHHTLWADLLPTGTTAVPVLTLEPAPLTHWARLVCGEPDGSAQGVVVNGAPLMADSDTAVADTPAQTAEERVAHFRATASPMARRLAGYLAAVPLTLPVIRLVQRVMLPHSRQVHLAEVFLSGLLQRVTPDGLTHDPDLVQYDFCTPRIRDILLDAVPTPDSVAALRAASREVLHQLSLTVGQEVGRALDFDAILSDPDGLGGTLPTDPAAAPFAGVAARVLRRLGGRYAHAAARLEQQYQLHDSPYLQLPTGPTTAAADPVPAPSLTDEITAALAAAERIADDGLAAEALLAIAERMATTTPPPDTNIARCYAQAAQRFARAGRVDEAKQALEAFKRYHGAPLIAGYDIVEVLTHHALTIDYRARGRAPAHDVVIRVLHQELLATADERERAYADLQPLRRLRGTAILPVHEVGIGEDDIYVIEDYVPQSHQLTAVLAARGRLPWEEALGLLTAVSSALDSAHADGVAHGSLTPDAIIVTATTIAVRGFGLAPSIDRATAHQRAVDDSPLTPPHYLAPEVGAGGSYTPAADCYALACLAYELITGARLFNGIDQTTVRAQQLAGPAFPDEWPLDVPHRVDQVLQRALAPSPADRYPSAGEFIRALSQLLSLPPQELSQPKPTLGYAELAHARDTLRTLIQRTRSLINIWDDRTWRDDLLSLQQQAEASVARIVVTGSAEAGKTSVVNALVGSAVLPTRGATDKLLTISWGSNPAALIHRAGAAPLKISLQALGDYLQREQPVGLITTEISWPHGPCQYGITLVETPRLTSFNSGWRQTLTANDVICVVISAIIPLTQFEREFLTSLITDHTGTIWVVLTHYDVLEAPARAQVTQTLQDFLAAKAAPPPPIYYLDTPTALRAVQTQNKVEEAASGLGLLAADLETHIATSLGLPRMRAISGQLHQTLVAITDRCKSERTALVNREAALRGALTGVEEALVATQHILTTRQGQLQAHVQNVMNWLRSTSASWLVDMPRRIERWSAAYRLKYPVRQPEMRNNVAIQRVAEEVASHLGLLLSEECAAWAKRTLLSGLVQEVQRTPLAFRSVLAARASFASLGTSGAALLRSITGMTVPGLARDLAALSDRVPQGNPNQLNQAIKTLVTQELSSQSSNASTAVIESFVVEGVEVLSRHIQLLLQDLLHDQQRKQEQVHVAQRLFAEAQQDRILQFGRLGGAEIEIVRIVKELDGIVGSREA